MAPSKNVPRPTRKKGPPKTVDRRYHVQLGTTDHPDHVFHFTTEGNARAFIKKAINQHRAWCERYNKEGLKALDAAIADMDTLVFERERCCISRVFDEHTGVKVYLEAWRT